VSSLVTLVELESLEPPDEGSTTEEPVTFENSWTFAEKVLETVDSRLQIDFSSDQDHILDSKMTPVEDAPCVFGEKSMWFSDMTNAFSARSVNYSELLRIPTSTLIQIARSDPRVKMRYDAFRQAVKQFEFFLTGSSMASFFPSYLLSCKNSDFKNLASFARRVFLVHSLISGLWSLASSCVQNF
jgi:hypothetical protein